MATATQNGDDLFRQAMSAWESAVESSAKMQEESAKWVREMFSNSSPLSEWYSKGQSVAGEAIVKAQESFDEAIRAVNQQAESSVRLIQKALDARQVDNASDARSRFADWWEAAVESMRTNSQAMMKANSHMLNTWSDIARKINESATDVVSHVAQKTAEQADKMAQSASEQVKEMVRQASGD
jgi:hypothetical protein